MGHTGPSVTLRIYEKSAISGGGHFDAYISSPSGYVVIKFMDDLAELRGFLDEAISEFSRPDVIPLVEGRKRLKTAKYLKDKQ